MSDRDAHGGGSAAVLEDDVAEGVVAVPAPTAVVVHAEPDRATIAAVPRVASGDLLAIGAFLALGTGLVESGFWLVRKLATGELACLPGGLCWMSPTAQLAIFALPAVALVGIARLAGRPLSTQVAVTCLSGLGWLNVVLLVPGLKLVAYLLLAGGLATVTGRLAASHPVVTLRAVRRGLVWLALLVAGMAIVWQGSRLFRERHMMAALPAARAEAPNVLLLVLDTVRADAVGSTTGRASHTPQIDRFAERGVIFEQAQSTSPWTLPSHAGMFTSRLPSELTGDWLAPLDDQFPTLAEYLAEAGYATAGFVANTRYCSRETGLARGFAHYEDFAFSAADFAVCTAVGRKFFYGPLPPLLGADDLPGRKSAATVNDQFLDWHDQHRGRPFFALLNYWDTHDPYLAPPPYGSTATLTAGQRQMLRNWWWMTKQHLALDDIAVARSAHEECVRYLDAKIGELLKSLQERGTLQNTLVIITSDHGEHFGEHGLLLHGNSLYQPLVHIPLVMVWPGHVPQGQRVSTPVSLGELAATITAAVGSGRGPFRGRDLQRLWQGSPTASSEPPPALFSEIVSQAKFPPCHGHSPVDRGTMRSVRIGSVKYISNGDGQEELYDLDRDPGERHNLAADPAWLAALARCRKAIAGSLPR